jgi:hypothetical protein
MVALNPADGLCYLWFIDIGLENREYGRRDPLRWPSDTLYPQKLALTSPTRGGPAFLRYMKNAGTLISGWSDNSKSALTITNKFIYVWA